MKRLELTCKKYGRLKVTSFSHIDKVSYWNAECDCGNKVVVRGSYLIFGHTLSCGCLQKENTSIASTTHGECRKTKEHKAWLHMKERCFNSKNKDYKNYGGRGITVCSRWIHSYANFLSDMGRSPSIKHSIDRINNDGIYKPSNCKWSTPKEQANNRRTSKKYRSTFEMIK